MFGLEDVSVSYSGSGRYVASTCNVHKNLVTAFIGPSGCGKTTLLRSLNRMNDLIAGAEVAGTITYHGHDLNASGVDPVEVRRRIGMVFQRPNPIPEVDLRQRRVRTAAARHEGQPERPRREGATPVAACGTR